jgi:hypothetical protein
MEKDQHFDTLAEFHFHNPDNAAYATIAHLVTLLEQGETGSDRATILRSIADLIGDAEALHILQIACRKLHVDYLKLINECQSIAGSHIIAPRLLMYLICLPIPYISEKLQVDEYRASQLLDELRRNFIIDDPIKWLKLLLELIEQERLHYAKQKEDLLHGLAVTTQPVDTAEERKLRERRLNPLIKAPTITEE